MTASPVQGANLEELIKQGIESSFEGIEDRITTRVHNLSRGRARLQEASTGLVPTPGASKPIQDPEVAVISEYPQESKSSPAGSGSRNLDWPPTRKAPSANPPRFQSGGSFPPPGLCGKLVYLSVAASVRRVEKMFGGRGITESETLSAVMARYSGMLADREAGEPKVLVTTG